MTQVQRSLWRHLRATAQYVLDGTGGSNAWPAPKLWCACRLPRMADEIEECRAGRDRNLQVMLRVFGADHKAAGSLYAVCLAWVQRWFVSEVEWLLANVPRHIVRDVFV